MKTEDIVMATTLKLNGYKLINIEKLNLKGRFEFEDVDQQFLTDYDLGNCQVEPKAFNNTLRGLVASVKR